MKKHIPNAITCCNLVCGCIATLYAFRGDYPAAFLFILLGAAADFLVGLAARLLGVSSPVGKELDSLADDITFGLAPSATAFSLLAADTPVPGLPYAAFLMAAFSALRLAKFNLDERQALGFIGLPTPANALFWGSLSLLAGGGAAAGAAWLPWVLLGLVALSCWLLVCEVPMFALKFKHYGLRGNEVRYGFILFSAAALIVGGRSAFVAIVPCYVVLSVFLWLIKNK